MCVYWKQDRVETQWDTPGGPRTLVWVQRITDAQQDTDEDTEALHDTGEDTDAHQDWTSDTLRAGHPDTLGHCGEDTAED